MSAVAFELWAAALRFVYAEGDLLRGDGVMHWSWCPDAEALGYDCTFAPDGFELAAVRIEPRSVGNNSERVLKVFRLQRSETSGREVFRVSWDEAEGHPATYSDLSVEKFERGLWEAALRTSALNGVIA